MKRPHFEDFLAEAVHEEPDNERGLSSDELYGLYTSWCLLKREQLQAPEALWEGLKAQGITPGNNHLVMTGPAAADYIIASAPNLV